MGVVLSLEGRLVVVRDKYQAARDQDRQREYRQRAAARAQAAKQRALRGRRSAPWANRRAIVAFYAEAQRLTRETGIPHEVDHIIPLLGKNVSGLHVENNLRVLPFEDNRRKSNRFDAELHHELHRPETTTAHEGRKSLISLVGDAGFEPATPAV